MSLVAFQHSTHRLENGDMLDTCSWLKVKQKHFGASKTYRSVSADGSRILEATAQKSCFSSSQVTLPPFLFWLMCGFQAEVAAPRHAGVAGGT